MSVRCESEFEPVICGSSLTFAGSDFNPRATPPPYQFGKPVVGADGVGMFAKIAHDLHQALLLGGALRVRTQRRSRRKTARAPHRHVCR